ncbi:type I restriction endonuclease subunit R [Mucilaginibacter calamicampi]|uniref:Type I restriction enzyme endonuclease subunit n=1 Tax=Mucilaginibacter calamicampi TaxID=1302352 RepID=A0ABW2Z1H9_9SPHI
MNSINPIERITQDRVIKLFQNELDYIYYGNWEERAGNSNIETQFLEAFLRKQGYNEHLVKKAISETLQLAHTSSGNLYDRNKNFYSLLRYGVKARPELGEQFETINLIDWQHPNNNEFGIAEEVSLRGNSTRRPDIVLYINGIAITTLELKRGTVDIAESIRQSISNSRETFNDWFYTTVQVLFAGNNTQGLRYGAIETPEKYYLSWKEDEADNSRYKLDKYLLKVCEKSRLLDILYNAVIYDAGVKKLPRPHQYHALTAAREFIRRREGGIIWHTQGSGKSLMMVMLAKWTLENISNSRVVILTDRTELDQQIEGVFKDVGEKDIARTTSGRELIDFLTGSRPRLICSLVHKFGNRSETDFDDFIKELRENPVQTQGEIFVFVDECHRTQSGKLNEAMKMILSDAVFVGFTGTPLLKQDKQTTMDIFGRYIHTYKFNEAVEDGVVKDLMYEGRDIEQKLSNQSRVDEWFEAKTRGLNDFQKNELKKKWGTMQRLLSSKSRMEKIVQDILFDFSTKPRLSAETGNAILVAGSIYEACKYWSLFQETELKSKTGLITSYNPHTSDITKEDTGADTDTEKEVIYKAYEKLLQNVTPKANKTKTESYEIDTKDRFRKEPARMKLLIVVSKLLTGFDAPPCSYIYIDKKMQDHTLFQAICRVNRLDTDDKDFGYIVDYMELFGKVSDSINLYTSELDSETFTKEEVEIVLKDRLKMARERLETALETLEAICDGVESPGHDLQYIHYFCGNTEIPEELKANEPKRMALYKSIVAYLRAFTSLKPEMEAAGYNAAAIRRFENRLDFYLHLREIIRIASGETLDLKAYEADMRFLIDHYIQADDAVKVSPFDDISLLDLLGIDINAAIEGLPNGIKGNKEAVAETIENNVRSKLIESYLLDPKYFEKMSALLQELIEERKRGAINYEEYLRKMAVLARDVKNSSASDIPRTLNTKGKVAIYHILADESLALACDDAIKYSKQDGFRENTAKSNLLKQAIFAIVQSKDKVQAIYDVVAANKEDYR